MMYGLEIFSELGKRLASVPHDIINKAVAANGWFNAGDIISAVSAIRNEMLDGEKLMRWASAYELPVSDPKNVGVIMAGNIPLVGFADMLYVLAAGHRCFIKPSGKDTVLMEYMISLLKDISPGVPLFYMGEDKIDAVIATGSDNTNRYFRSIYKGIPALLRGSRGSVAVLNGNESEKEIELLARDIFSYSGLGCRNVSLIFIPEGYDIERLSAMLSRHDGVNTRYRDNYRQRKSLLTMQGEDFTDGGFFILRNGNGFPDAISEIRYSSAHAGEWLSSNDTSVQCVAGYAGRHPRGVALGDTQSPALADYADGTDVISFLQKLD